VKTLRFQNDITIAVLGGTQKAKEIHHKAEPKLKVTMEHEKMVVFDVGGHIHKLPRSLLDRFPDTMLARQADKIWQKEDCSPSTTPLYVDRNGIRFQYVMDFMRDGQVHLPLTISKKAFLKDMDYLGFTDKDINESSIHVATVAQAEEIVASVSDNLHEEIDKLEKAIKEHKKTIDQCKAKKLGLRVAYDFFVRSSAGENGTQDRVTIHLDHGDALQQANEACWDNNRSTLEECLAKYGLTLVSVKWAYNPSLDGGVIVLDRSNKKQKTGGEGENV
jgi:hypothetical protein